MFIIPQDDINFLYSNILAFYPKMVIYGRIYRIYFLSTEL